MAMNAYGYKRGYSGYQEWSNDDIDSATIHEQLHNIELNNKEEPTWMQHSTQQAQ